MIESGTNTPGISAADFRLPPRTALRYEKPAPALRDLLLSYAVLDSDPVEPEGTRGVMLPTWGQIWVVMTDGPITVGIGNRQYAPLSSAILYGVTSRGMPVTANGGVTVCIDLGPCGWARFIATPADALRDRITPLAEVLPVAMVEDLIAGLHESNRADEVQSVLDQVFTRHLPAPHPDEPIVARIQALIAEETTTDLVSAAGALGIDVRTLRRISKRYFGFPPKMLMIRARFVRAVIAGLLASDQAEGVHRAVASYYDASHLNRDAQRFLGMPLGRFLRLDASYLTAVLRARRLVLGAATPSLA